ncbi:MAG: RNA methyltransferase [Acidimicrobiia bacterium]|nr:RNA methyltransferase [Acidimicrobiia bacterium]
MAIEHRPEAVDVVFHLADQPFAAPSGIELVAVTEPVLERLSTTTTPQSPVAIVKFPDLDGPQLRPSVVAWGIADPGNLGAMIRSSAAFGVQMVIGPDCADVWSPKAIRAAAGVSLSEPPTMIGTLEELRGFATVACVADRGEPELPSVDMPIAALIGSEARGLPSEVSDNASKRLTLPLAASVESLNAAVTAGIVAYLLGSGRSADLSGTVER